jgi:Flp pilus assembly pilin Flp
MPKFFQCEAGQDITEYTLVLAFVVIVSAALFTLNGNSVSAIWTAANSNLSKAHSSIGL